MNWLVAGLLSWLLLGMELGLRPELRLGRTDIAPSFIFCLVTFIAMAGPAASARWAALAAGLVMDVISGLPVKDSGAEAYLLGPHALGYLLGCQLVLTLRGVMIRHNPLALAFLAAVGAAVANATVAAIVTLRAQFGDPLEWSAAERMLHGMASALYTGLAAGVLALVFFPLAPLMGLHSQQKGRFGRKA